MKRIQIPFSSKDLGLFLAGVAIVCLFMGGIYFLWLRAGIRRSENILVQRSTLRPCVEMPTNLHEHRFLPNCKGLSRIGALEAEISFNSQGVRGPDYPHQPEPGVLRILVLGSSNVLGLGMPDFQTMPFLIQKNLSRELGRRVQVINGAVFGYSTWQSATSLRRLLRAYHPHLVIYHLSVPTYFLFDSIWESRLIKDSSGDPLAIDRSIFSDSSYFRSLNPFLYRHVNIFLYLHSLHEQLRRLVFSWRLKGKAPAQQAEIISAATIRALRYMNHITELEGAKFFAYFHNSNEQIFGGYVPEVLHRNAAIFISALMPESPPIVRIVQKLMETMEFPVRMIQFEHAQDRTIPGEVHLNPVGLAAWEKAIRAKLWESRVLEPFKAPASRGHGQVVK